MDPILVALGVRPDDMPISDRDIRDWTAAQLDRAVTLLRTCRETYGIGESRKLFPMLGLPEPPPEIVDPLPGEQRRQ